MTTHDCTYTARTFNLMFQIHFIFNTGCNFSNLVLIKVVEMYSNTLLVSENCPTTNPRFLSLVYDFLGDPLSTFLGYATSAWYTRECIPFPHVDSVLAFRSTCLSVHPVSKLQLQRRVCKLRMVVKCNEVITERSYLANPSGLDGSVSEGSCFSFFKRK